MRDTNTLECIRQKYLALSPVRDERMRRQWAAAEASALGWGGVTAVSLATGLRAIPSPRGAVNWSIDGRIRRKLSRCESVAPAVDANR